MDELTRYIAEDAERWYAMHARLNAVGLALYAMGLPLAAQPHALRSVIRVLQTGLTSETSGSQPHPAFAADVEKLIEGWQEAMRPYPVADPS